MGRPYALDPLAFQLKGMSVKDPNFSINPIKKKCRMLCQQGFSLCKRLRDRKSVHPMAPFT